MNASLADRLRCALQLFDGVSGETMIGERASTAPTNLVRACLASLPVVGVVCSCYQDQLSVPLAGVGTDALRAEQIETSLGCGPTFTARTTGRPHTARFANLQRPWPLMAHQIRQRTCIRSIVAFPLPTLLNRSLPLVVSLYFDTPHPHPQLQDTEDQLQLGDVIATWLNAHATAHPQDIAYWLSDAPAVARHHVWTALGMLTVAFNVSLSDALALLRGAAFSRDLSIDELATLLRSKHIATTELEN